jgi:serine protease Do
VGAIGHPEHGGLLWTLTTGVVRAEVDNFNGVKGKQVFHTETGLNRGNSGGPLLDGEGWMIGVNTVIARVASDGLPINSIGFSFKSSVARQWLREQGVGVRAGQVQPVTAQPLAQSVQPQADPVRLPQSDLSFKPTMKAEVIQPVPVRPYNLGQRISDRTKAEADLGYMIKDMRGEMDHR